MKGRTLFVGILKGLLILLGVVMLAFGAILLFATEPWVRVTEVRVSNDMDDLRVSIGRACEKEFISEVGNPVHLILCLPQGSVSPWDTKAGLANNEFIVRGYRYKEIARNLVTGSAVERASLRIDVVEWNAVVPYQVYSPQGDTYSHESVEPIGWKADKALHEQMNGQSILLRENMKCIE